MKTAEEICRKLNIKQKMIVSIVGSGGKTTLIREMADYLSQESAVGLAVSTKIKYPVPGTYDGLYIGTEQVPDSPLKPGIYYFADENADNNKLSGLSEELLKKTSRCVDIILNEADGSKRLPLKGWNEYEPVVPRQTDVTIGIIPVRQIGQEVSGQFIHRLPLFMDLLGIGEATALTCSHLATIIRHKNGLFKNACGRRVLVINQAEDQADMKNACRIADMVRMEVDDIFIRCDGSID